MISNRLRNLCLIPVMMAVALYDTALAGAEFGWFFYQQGEVTTKVDGAKEYSAPHYPVGYDLLLVEEEIYFQIGIDMGGRWVWDVLSIINEDALAIDAEEYGMDESFCNLKGGVMSSGGAASFAYGLDLDWRVNKYRDLDGSTASQEKIRVGLGPNLGLRLKPHNAVTLFPNASGYFYPWPNKDFAFIPKTFDSYGYRLELPVIIDLIGLLAPGSKKSFVVSAMPFMGSKSGFFKGNDQTGETKDATASVYGIKFGAYWKLDIFTFMWKD